MGSIKVLLVGGPCSWKTVELPSDQYEVLVALPPRVDLLRNLDPYEPAPMDLQVARYVRSGPIEQDMGGGYMARHGWIFTFEGTR